MKKIISKLNFEYILFLITLILFTVIILRAVLFYSSSSLYTDEIYSIAEFSSRGFIHSVTDYKQPNNHIFFNALNSILPYSDSFHPFRARIVSIISVVLSVIILLRIFVLRKKYLGGIFLVSFLFISEPLLELFLMARGYGILMFFTTVILLYTEKFIVKPGKNYLGIIIISGILGSWTLPPFAIFFGILLTSIFLLTTKKKAVFISGLAYIIIISLLYLPVLKELLWHMSNYSEDWPKEFEKGQALFGLFRIYTPLNYDYQILVFLFLCFFAALINGFKNKERHFYIILISSFLLTISIFLFMETPPLRTASFLLVLPIYFLSASFHFNKFDQFNYPIFKYLLYFLIGSLLLLNFKNAKYVPLENWREVANFLQSNKLSQENVFVNFRPNFLASYLEDKNRIQEKFNKKEFYEGNLVYVDADFFDLQNRGKEFLYDRKNIKTILFEQKRGNYQLVHYYDQTPGQKFIISDSLGINIKCCNSWQGAELILPEGVSKFTYISFDLNATALSNVENFQVLFTDLEGNNPSYVSLRITPNKSRYIVGYDFFKESKLTIPNSKKIIFRVKVRNPVESESLLLKNIEIRP